MIFHKSGAGALGNNGSFLTTFSMLGFLPSFMRGVIATVLLAINTLFWCSLLFTCALVKLLLPFRAVRVRTDSILNAIATCWVACNSGWMRLTQRTQWDVQGLDDLRYEGWYLVNCNHQTWADIFVLQYLLNRRIPMLKFFLKQQLIYVPVIGLAWWALDFPFMKRHGKAQLRKHPELRAQDAQATRRACAKFALVPTSVMNFAEGTRFTAAKHAAQNSPYRHLLKPKAGAIALALNAMGERFHSLVDVTIVYAACAPGFWRFLCGDTPRVQVRIRQVAIPAQFCTGDYETDPAFRMAFQQWLLDLWQHKDAEIHALLEPDAVTNSPRGGLQPMLSGLWLVLGLLLLSPGTADAIGTLSPEGLRAQYAAMAPRLSASPFQGPLILESKETSSSNQGDVYAVVAHSFAEVSSALGDSSIWCDILILHQNTKYCRSTTDRSPARIDLRVGRKFDQPLADAQSFLFTWRAVAMRPDYIDIELDAPEGPLGTRDYRIVLEAIPIADGRTFIHMAYSFGMGASSQFAMNVYLATLGSGKVGFTQTGTPGQAPRYIGGRRGMTERNTMRYYLAIDSFLDTMSLPAGQRMEKSFQGWFNATEKYPQQLREMDAQTYLAMKRKEYQRQRIPVAP